MAALHDALTSLGPVEYSSVPQETEALTTYLQSAFEAARVIIDSVPSPPPTDLPSASSVSQPSEAKDLSDIVTSSARSDLLDPENAGLQKEWGKPLKMSAKDNPLNISTYKLGGKDGKGAWFARRSVHSGMSFKRWQKSLEREFPETLETQGGPGVGNIRGIGGEKKVESKHVPEAGTQEVYYLTAQFPGPSAPRDFVTLLLVSSNALGKKEENPSKHIPRHYLVISKPCIHPETPARNGFVRGQYESVEFIREIPRRPKRAASALDLTTASNETEPKTSTTSKGDVTVEQADTKGAGINAVTRDASRRRSKTVSLSKPLNGATQQDDDDDDDKSNPVEWIMITRSDPGGSVPRFMVERGTPGSIVADASKFLAWATKKDHSESESHSSNTQRDTTEKVAAAEGSNKQLHELQGDRAAQTEAVSDKAAPPQKSASHEQLQSSGILATLTSAAKSGIENYAPKVIADQLPGHTVKTTSQDTAQGDEADAADGGSLSEASSPTASFVSFGSSEDNADDGISTQSPSSNRKSGNEERKSAETKEVERLNERKRLLDEKLTKTREKESKDREQLTAREEQRIRKAEEKHAREVAKSEAQYAKQMAKLEAKQRKTEEKDDKVRLTREKEDLRKQLATATTERDLLLEQVRALQKENTALVLRLGKVDDGKRLLAEVQSEVSRSRSSSLRKLRSSTPDPANGSIAIGKGLNLKENQPPT